MMNSSLRFGTALSALALAALLSGCATGERKAVAGNAAAPSKAGLAMRALAALQSGNFATAVKFAEEAVQHSPGQAPFRAVLGNAYFGAGRFASAAAAYRDSLSLDAGQPNVVLKLALAEIAQGKNAQALADLEVARPQLDAADYGLAIALAGQPADAVAVLGQAARLPGADARLRQNLALAHALSGDWTMARTIAAQDVPPDQLDSRIQQWMAMAAPKRASDQVAALTGITPAADPGQPVHLALNKAQSAPRLAQAAPMPPQVAAVIPAAAPESYVAPQPVEYVEPEAQVAPMVAELPPAPAPQMPTIVEAMHAAAPAALADTQVAQVLTQPAAQAESPVAPVPARFESKPSVAKLLAASARKPERASGRSNSVVQLGAYGSVYRVMTAWNQFARRYDSLNRYMPVTMPFETADGTVYRLSVKGFASVNEAQQLCSALKGKGASCFVRRVAGDAPVQMASR